MKKIRYLVVGAGVSGLAFANFIKNKDYLILEKSNAAGGFCKTIKKDGFIWDYAGHFFHFANEELKNFFEGKIDRKDIIYKEKNTKIYYKDRYIEYPFQKNIHQLPKSEFIDCLYDLFNKNEKDNYCSFEEMLYGKFGKSITEKFLKPYNEKLYACDLNDLDSEAMGRFFPYANVQEIIENMKLEEDTSYNNVFLYPRNGAVTFVNALLEGTDPEKILYNTELMRLDLEKKVAYTTNGEYQYEYLINSSPFNHFVSGINEELNVKAHEILSYNKVLVLNLGFDKKSDISDFHWVYLPDKDINFYRIGFYDNILESNRLSMYIEIGYKADDVINIEQELSDSLKNLKEIGVITDHQLVSYSSVVMSPAYVHISEEGKKFKEETKKMLHENKVYSIGRYGDWKYCSIEDSILDAIKVAKCLNE